MHKFGLAEAPKPGTLVPRVGQSDMVSVDTPWACQPTHTAEQRRRDELEHMIDLRKVLNSCAITYSLYFGGVKTPHIDQTTDRRSGQSESRPVLYRTEGMAAVWPHSMECLDVLCI